MQSERWRLRHCTARCGRGCCLASKQLLEFVHRMAAVLKKPLWCILGLPPSTVRPPPTVTLPIQIGTLFHCFASSRFLTVGQSSSDASVLQTGLKLPPAQFCNHATQSILRYSARPRRPSPRAGLCYRERSSIPSVTAGKLVCLDMVQC